MTRMTIRATLASVLLAGFAGAAQAGQVLATATDDGMFTTPTFLGIFPIGPTTYAAGTGGTLQISGAPSGFPIFVYQDADLAFALSGVPAGATITSATLTMYDTDSSTTDTVGLQGFTSSGARQ